MELTATEAVTMTCRIVTIGIGVWNAVSATVVDDWPVAKPRPVDR